MPSPMILEKRSFAIAARIGAGLTRILGDRSENHSGGNSSRRYEPDLRSKPQADVPWVAGTDHLITSFIDVLRPQSSWQTNRCSPVSGRMKAFSSGWPDQIIFPSRNQNILFTELSTEASKSIF